MAWNEPEDKRARKPNEKDPWGGPRQGGGPPDLEEVLGKILDKLSLLLGLKTGNKGNGNAPGPGRRDSSGNGFPFPVWIPVLVLLGGWLAFDMSHFIDQRERGVVLRFGEHVATLTPGLSIRMPRPLEEVLRVNVRQVRSILHKTSMLTQDENIVEVAVNVQWRIKNPEYYLFNVLDPEVSLRQITESAVRDVVGKSKLDFVTTVGRSEVASRQGEIIQNTLDEYVGGIEILGVEIQSADPPDAVKVAFDDVTKAREDRERLINEAEAYRNDIIPKARGAAVRLREESNAYKARVIAKSEGEAKRFEQLLTEYQRAPKVTRQRLYLDAVENVLRNSNKVLIDKAVGGNNLTYIPLDKLIEQQRRSNSDQQLPGGDSLHSSGGARERNSNDQPNRIRRNARGAR